MLMNISGETEEEFSTRLANNLEELILKEGPDTVIFICMEVSPTTSTLTLSLTSMFIFYFLLQIAAFIAEPVMGAGGVILPPSTYFDKVFSYDQCFTHEFQTFMLDVRTIWYR